MGRKIETELRERNSWERLDMLRAVSNRSCEFEAAWEMPTPWRESFAKAPQAEENPGFLNVQ